jgi:hypothetical protein
MRKHQNLVVPPEKVITASYPPIKKPLSSLAQVQSKKNPVDQSEWLIDSSILIDSNLSEDLRVIAQHC